jgi:hypothetical protein
MAGNRRSFDCASRDEAARDFAYKFFELRAYTKINAFT